MGSSVRSEAAVARSGSVAGEPLGSPVGMRTPTIRHGVCLRARPTVSELIGSRGKEAAG